MKELKKRCRGLFVLLLAATFFLQGGWFMPSEAATGEEYLIVMQNMVLAGSELEGAKSDGTNPVANAHYGDARVLGVYKGTGEAIKSMITNNQISNSNVRSLEQGGLVEKLDNIADINSPSGATLYCLTANASGCAFRFEDQTGSAVSTSITGAPVDVRQSASETSYGDSHYFYTIENVSKVTEAKLMVNERETSAETKYCDYSLPAASAWKTVTAGTETAVADVMNDPTSDSKRATAGYEAGVAHYLKVNIIDPERLTTITFDTDGGSKIDPITQEIGTPVTKPADPTKAGYTFAGWEPAFPAEMPETNITLKAKWNRNVYTITYVLNGGKLDGQTGTVTKKVDAGTVITLPAPTKDGFTFDYWEGSKYNAGDKYTVNEDHTFKAVWKAADSGDNDNKSKSSGADDEDGSESSSGKKGVKTGDENNLGFWIFLMSAALIGFAGMAFSTIKRR